jgi:hypothetical protein
MIILILMGFYCDGRGGGVRPGTATFEAYAAVAVLTALGGRKPVGVTDPCLDGTAGTGGAPLDVLAEEDGEGGTAGATENAAILDAIPPVVGGGTGGAVATLAPDDVDDTLAATDGTTGGDGDGDDDAVGVVAVLGTGGEGMGGGVDEVVTVRGVDGDGDGDAEPLDRPAGYAGTTGGARDGDDNDDVANDVGGVGAPTLATGATGTPSVRLPVLGVTGALFVPLVTPALVAEVGVLADDGVVGVLAGDIGLVTTPVATEDGVFGVVLVGVTGGTIASLLGTVAVLAATPVVLVLLDVGVDGVVLAVATLDGDTTAGVDVLVMVEVAEGDTFAGDADAIDETLIVGGFAAAVTVADVGVVVLPFRGLDCGLARGDD